MFLIKSSLKRRNMHFVSCSADGRQGHANRLCPSCGCANLALMRPPATRPESRRQSRRPSGRLRTPSASNSASASPSRRPRVRLLHAQPQIRGRDLDAGPQQDPFAAALRRRRPHRFQDLLRLPEIAAVVEHDAVAQRRMPRRHVTAKARRHQRCDLRQRFVIGVGLRRPRRERRPIAAAAGCRR